jgi:hypothetical protein
MIRIETVCIVVMKTPLANSSDRSMPAASVEMKDKQLSVMCISLTSLDGTFLCKYSTTLRNYSILIYHLISSNPIPWFIDTGLTTTHLIY